MAPITLVFFPFFALVAIMSSIHVNAAPIQARQLGDVTCNINRLKTVVGILGSIEAVINVHAMGDPAVKASLRSAREGLSIASAGIEIISVAIFEGAVAPADVRDQTAQGIVTALTALQGISQVPGVDVALAKLDGAAAASNDVVTTCV